MKRLFTTALLAFLALGNHAFARDLPNFTNLGETGNQYANGRFERYKAGGFVCGAPRADRVRVVLAGFGPFAGDSENISGAVLRAFGNFTRPLGDTDVYGATRELNIEGVDYQVCFLVTSVMWDISAAILITEIERFSPSFALLSGVGGERTVFEAGNSNRARALTGHELSGAPASDNTPAENYVLPPDDPNVSFISRLTWDPEAARLAADPEVTAMGFQTVVPPAGYESNNYLCNNVAFALSHSARGFRTVLAGGKIVLEPRGPFAPKIGFLHYPYRATTDAESLGKWRETLKRVILSQR